MLPALERIQMRDDNGGEESVALVKQMYWQKENGIKMDGTDGNWSESLSIFALQSIELENAAHTDAID